MKRAVIALVLALAALALLISLALGSRSLPVETHVAQYTIAGDLERFNGDFRALVDTLQSAWIEQTPPGEGARALLERVAAQPQQLPESLFTMQGSASQKARLNNSHETFIGAVSQATALAEELVADQTAYTAAVSFLREKGASVIQELRDAEPRPPGRRHVPARRRDARLRRQRRLGSRRLSRSLARHARPGSTCRLDARRVRRAASLRRNDPDEQAAHRKQAAATRRHAGRRPRGGLEHGGSGHVHDRRHAYRASAADALRLRGRSVARRRLHRAAAARQLSRDQPRQRRPRRAQRIARATRRSPYDTS